MFSKRPLNLKFFKFRYGIQSFLDLHPWKGVKLHIPLSVQEKPGLSFEYGRSNLKKSTIHQTRSFTYVCNWGRIFLHKQGSRNFNHKRNKSSLPLHPLFTFYCINTINKKDVWEWVTKLSMLRNMRLLCHLPKMVFLTLSNLASTS